MSSTSSACTPSAAPLPSSAPPRVSQSPSCSTTRSLITPSRGGSSTWSPRSCSLGRLTSSEADSSECHAARPAERRPPQYKWAPRIIKTRDGIQFDTRANLHVDCERPSLRGRPLGVRPCLRFVLTCLRWPREWLRREQRLCSWNVFCMEARKRKRHREPFSSGLHSLQLVMHV